MATNKRTPSVKKSGMNLFTEEFPQPTPEKKPQTLKELDSDTFYETQFIKLKLIDDSPANKYSLNNIEELAESIAKFVLLSPINIREKGDGTYELLSGHRRRKAYELIYNLYLAWKAKDELKLEEIELQFAEHNAENSYKKILASIEKNPKRFAGYNCIPSLVFPQNMSELEINDILNEANIHARHLKLEDAMKHIDYFIQDLNPDLSTTTLKSIAEYVYTKFQKLGFEEWKCSQILTYVTIHLQGTPELKQAFFNNELSVKNARFIAAFDAEKQLEILQNSKQNPHYLDELKIEKKKNAIGNKLNSYKRTQKNNPVKTQTVEKSITDINKSITKLKVFNLPISNPSDEEKENLLLLRTRLLETRKEVFDTLASIELLLKNSIEK